MSRIIITDDNIEKYNEDVYPEVISIVLSMDYFGNDFCKKFKYDFSKKFPALQTLDCSHSELTTLNFAGHGALQYLNCSYNGLTSLNITNCNYLRKLNCSCNELTTLNVANLNALQELDCSDNALTTLNFVNLTALQELNCSDNILTTLNVANLPALRQLDCSVNRLTTLNITDLPALRDLSCKCKQTISIYGIEKCHLEYFNHAQIGDIFKNYDIFKNHEILIIDKFNPVVLGNFTDPKKNINPEIIFLAINDICINRFNIPQENFENMIGVDHNDIAMKVYCRPNYPAIHGHSCTENQIRILIIMSMIHFSDTAWNQIPNELLFEIFLCQNPFHIFQ